MYLALFAKVHYPKRKTIPFARVAVEDCERIARLIPARLCGNDGMGSFGGCVLTTGCEQGGAKNQAQEGYCRLPIADCRLPIADCRLPIADCRLPIADCRLPILRQRRLRSSWSGWFVSCLFLLYYANDFCHRQKPLYIKKPEYQVFL